MDSIKNKKILMLCYYFSPYMEVGSLRSRKYAQYLPSYGYSCEIITAYQGNDVASMFPESVHIHPTLRFDFMSLLSAVVTFLSPIRYIIFKILHAWRSRKNAGEQNSHITIGGFGIANRVAKWFLLPDTQFLWIFLALPKALWFARRCDVIYSSAWPVSAHVLGLIIHKITQKPWVADYRDEWTLNSQWQPPTRFHRWIGETMDKACVKNAHYIVNVTEQRSQNFKKKYFAYADRCVTIHNGYDEGDVSGFRGRKLAEDYILLTSIGSLYGGRDPSTFLEAIKELLDDGYINSALFSCLLINARDPKIELLIDQLHLADVVRILPWRPQNEAYEYLAKSHVALLIGSDMAKTAMTSKLYEYAGMGKFIFGLVPEGSAKEFVERCSGMVADPKDKSKIKAALKTIISKWQNGQISCIHTAAIAPASQYERSALAWQLAELFNKAAIGARTKPFK